MADDSKPVNSIGDFIFQVSARAKKWRKSWEKKREKHGTTAIAWLPWFRGEPSVKVDFPLTPKLYRRKISDRDTLNVVLECEGELRNEFERCASQLITEGREPRGKWERYFLMQHFSAPTRLLDWTDGALMALHFALKDRGALDDRFKGNPVVYMLDPWSLNRKAFKYLVLADKSERPVGVALPDWDEAKPYLKNEFDNEELGELCPLAIDPSQISRRIAAQRSHFTIFARKPHGLREAVGDNNGSILHCIEVDRKYIPSLKKDLKVCGTSESSAFPDLEGLGRELDQTLHAYLKQRLEKR